MRARVAMALALAAFLGCGSAPAPKPPPVIAPLKVEPGSIDVLSLVGDSAKRVLISQSTYERCQVFVDTRGPIDIYLKGKPVPVSLRELIGIPSLGFNVPRKEKRRSHRIRVKLPFGYQIIENGIGFPEIRPGTILDLGYHGALLELERGALHVMEAAGRLAQGQGPIEGQGVAGAASITLGGHHGDFPYLGDGSRESLQTRGKITVVVAQQNTHWEPEQAFSNGMRNRETPVWRGQGPIQRQRAKHHE